MRKQIRKDREEKDHCREQTRQQKKFMADKNAFAKELFNPPNATVPTFDVNIAYEHFNATNEDKTRNVMLKAMPGWSQPKKPNILRSNQRQQDGIWRTQSEIKRRNVQLV